jgi:hypothetical protein
MLVGGLEHEFYDFPYIGNVIGPQLTHIFIYFSEGLGRSTTHQIYDLAWLLGLGKSTENIRWWFLFPEYLHYTNDN